MSLVEAAHGGDDDDEYDDDEDVGLDNDEAHEHTMREAVYKSAALALVHEVRAITPRSSVTHSEPGLACQAWRHSLGIC